jgi:carbon-monoxide dehydrogenase medium subunit
MYDFAYQKPGKIADVVALLADPEAKVLAGGQTFIPVLKQRLNKPSTVIDLAGLGLAGITAGAETITIGAMTTHAEIAADAGIAKHIPGLSEMAGWIGDTQVRHRGTMGGSLANNDPSACYPAAVLATGATIKTTTREIAAEDYFQGMFTTALAPDELIVSITFPFAPKSAYEKFRNPASRYAIVGAFVAQTKAGVRVAITGASQGGVFRHAGFEHALASSFTPEAIAGVKTEADGLNSDIHASAEYRAHLIGVMTKRAIAKAVAR